MKEQVLLDYFDNKVSIKSLLDDLKGSRQSNGTTFSLDIEFLENENSFLVKKTHALKLCDAVLNGDLTFEDLNTIAFVVTCSDAFNIDEEDENTDRFFDDWKETSVGYAWTLENMKKWIDLLEFGADTFDNAEGKWKND